MSDGLERELRKLIDERDAMLRREVDKTVSVDHLSPEQQTKHLQLIADLSEALQRLRRASEAYLANPLSEALSAEMERFREDADRAHEALIEYRVEVGIYVTRDKATDLAEQTALRVLAVMQKHLPPDLCRTFAAELLADIDSKLTADHSVKRAMNTVYRRLLRAAAKPEPMED